jgi:hypothetical protein
VSLNYSAGKSCPFVEQIDECAIGTHEHFVETGQEGVVEDYGSYQDKIDYGDFEVDEAVC